MAPPRISSDGDEPEGEEWIALAPAALDVPKQIDCIPSSWAATAESSPPSRSIVRLLC